MSKLNAISFFFEELDDKRISTISGGSFKPPPWLHSKRNKTAMPFSSDSDNGGAGDADEVEDVMNSIQAASEDENFAREVIAVIKDTF